MTTLVGLILMMCLAIIGGKHTKRVRLAAYCAIILIALAQVSMTVYSMFTMVWQNP